MYYDGLKLPHSNIKFDRYLFIQGVTKHLSESLGTIVYRIEVNKKC